MSSIISREEIRRLQKAARDKDIKKLGEWLESYEAYLDGILRKDYDKAYQDEVESTVNNMMTAFAYTAYFSEENYVDDNNIGDYMNDLFSTLDMFRTGEYKPIEYKEILEKAGVYLDNYDYNGPYKKFLNIVDTELVRFLKGPHKRTVVVCGSPKYKEEVLKVSSDLALQNYMTFIDNMSIMSNNIEIVPEEIVQVVETSKEKILFSDMLYVVNKDKYIDNNIKLYIEFAKKHNKEIKYLEEPEEESKEK